MDEINTTQNNIESSENSGLQTEPQQEQSPSKKPFSFRHIVNIGLIVAFITIAGIVVVKLGLFESKSILKSPNSTTDTASTFEYKTFKNNAEMREYFQNTENDVVFVPFANIGLMRLDAVDMALTMSQESQIGNIAESTPERVSETNVQVKGIDEPDIVKVNDSAIYTSFYRYPPYLLEEPIPVDVFDPIELQSEDVSEESIDDSKPSLFPIGDEAISSRPAILPRENPQQATNIIKAFPQTELEKIGTIDQIGQLLLSNDILVILSDDSRNIYGYDVSNELEPKQLWTYSIENSTIYHDARIIKNDLYLVTKNFYDLEFACPYSPLLRGAERISIACDSIYYPDVTTGSNTTYTVMKIASDTGKIEKTLAIVGRDFDSVLYMNENNLYLTHAVPKSMAKIIHDFANEDGKELLKSESISRIKEIMGYDISEESKLKEIQAVLAKAFNDLEPDQRKTKDTELRDLLEKYIKEEVNGLIDTAITRIDSDNLDIEAQGTVSGQVLNQFSLDEYKDNLRIATHIVNNNQFSTVGDTNNVYILDSDLEIKGKVVDLGQDERIYSVRFMGDRGYVVTFRETDPFYVLDLSDPSSPKMEGELKIPGYSSYLHQLKENFILGVGKEGSNVKLSLFDVKNPKQPLETDNFQLKEEYWSDVLNTHRAFLHDAENEVFFIPGGNGGYIFSYENDELELKLAVDSSNVKRAVYIDDYMYIISDSEIIVISEETWSRVNEIKY